MYRNNRMMACYHSWDHVINVYPGPNVRGPHYLVTDEQHDTLHRFLAGLDPINIKYQLLSLSSSQAQIGVDILKCDPRWVSAVKV